MLKLDPYYQKFLEIPSTLPSLTVTNLTATRIPFIGTGGLFVDNANFIYTTATNALQNTGITTLISGAAASIPLTIKGAASQSGNLLNFINSAGGALSCFTLDGSLFLGNVSPIAGGQRLYVDSGASKNIILGSSTQSSTTQVWNNAGFGMRQATATANNYCVFTFYSSNWNDAAAVACKYINHQAGAPVGQVHFQTCKSPAGLTTQFIIDQNGDLTWGAGEAGKDYVLTVNGETNDGVWTWMEDEDYFLFADDIQLGDAEKLQWSDTNIYRSAANMLKTDDGFTTTGAFGCNNATAQTAYASGGALAAYATGAYGLDSDANMSALKTLVDNIRSALVANGIMS